MPLQLYQSLQKAEKHDALPSVIAYNRIDGPGSSLDLREFQQTLWSLPIVPRDPHKDVVAAWADRLPRTVGITVDIGTIVELGRWTQS